MTSGKETPVIYARSEIEAAAQHMQKVGVKPNITVVNISCVEEAENLIEKGLIEKPYSFSINLNTPAQGVLRGTPKNLMSIVERFPQSSIYTVSARGTAQIPLTTMAMLIGGHVRVGLEDNLYYAPGRLAKNAEQVERAVRVAKELNLEVATPDEAREMLQIGR